METTQLASGTLFIHSASTALRSHIEWAADAAFVMPAPLRWTSQPVEPGTWRAESAWCGDVVDARTFISTLAAWQRVRVELTVKQGLPRIAGASLPIWVFFPRPSMRPARFSLMR